MAKTIVELFEEQVHRSAVRPALRRRRDGIWEEFTWKEWWDASERIAAGLISDGVSTEERICVVVSTRLQWVVVDMGIAMAGGVSVAVDVETSTTELARVLSENDVHTVVVENPLQLGKVVEARETASTVERVVYIDSDVLVAAPGRRGGDFVRLESLAMPDDLIVESLDELRGRGREVLADQPRYVAGRRRKIDPEMPAVISYTAGVSDRPRGVILTHHNLAAQIEALASLQLFSSDDVHLLFLPLAHVFARILYLAAVGYGMTTVFGRGPEHLLEDLSEVEPTLMAAVPRIYERLQNEIVDRVRRRRWRSRLLPAALEVGKAVSHRVQSGEDVGTFLKWEHRLFSHLLLEDVRELLGGRMRFLIAGGAPLREETCEFFFATGVLLLEGYGLTETSGAVSFNMPDDFRIGSVGKPLPGIEVTIGEDDEILIRGDTVMDSYVTTDDDDGRVIDDRGWLHSGDIGRFDDDGFLYVTDRKRDAIVTSTGQHVAPQPIERRLRDHPLVAHAAVVGDGRPHLAALVALEPDAVLEFIDDSELDGRIPVRELTIHPRLRRELRAHVRQINRQVSSFERIRSFSVLPEFLSMRNRTLTAEGRLRRAELLRRYDAEIHRLYEEGESVEHVHDAPADQ